MAVLCLRILLLAFYYCRQLNTLVSVQAWQTIDSAFSACSDTKWLVSVAFFKRAVITISTHWSRSLVGSSEKTTCSVMHAFLATWDLKLSVCLTTDLMYSLDCKPWLDDDMGSRFLWNNAILLTTFRPSKTFCQSSDFKFSALCFNWSSGLRRGSSGAL